VHGVGGAALADAPADEHVAPEPVEGGLAGAWPLGRDDGGSLECRTQPVGEGFERGDHPIEGPERPLDSGGNRPEQGFLLERVELADPPIDVQAGRRTPVQGPVGGQGLLDHPRQVAHGAEGTASR
jgi:hypothetical protein